MTYSAPKVAIVDFGLGNLFSVYQACNHVQLDAEIMSSKDKILSADAVILPGVGAFADAMDSLHKLDLVSGLRDFIASGRPLLGVCLGMQLLMSESLEFGHHEGLNIIPGSVLPFGRPMEDTRALKVPQIGWNHVRMPKADMKWDGTLLDGLANGENMYFVHSFIVAPQDQKIVLATSRYGDVDFCSSLQLDNVMACQFHPERSGKMGLKIYQNFAALLDRVA